MLRWFYALLPREERFFDLFARHSETVAAGAEALRAMLEGGDAVPLHYQTVMDREHDADDVTREVLMAIRRSFITPFDRGDVKDLITSMDNAIDQMQKTAKTIMLFDQRAFTPQQRKVAARSSRRRLGAGGDAAVELISSNAGRISSISEELSQIEGRTDELHDVGLQGALPGQPAHELDGVLSSGSRSTTASRRWSTASTTWATRCTASCSRTCDFHFDGRDHARAAAAGRPDLGRARLRLPQRAARRRQLDRHHRVDARAAAADRRGLGCFFQFHRLSVLRRARRADHRHRHCLRRRHRSTRRVRRAHGRDPLEPDHLGARDSIEQLARADRRPGRRRHRQGRRLGYRLVRPRQDQCRDRAVAVLRLRAGAAAVPDRVVAVRALHAVRGRPPVPLAAIRLGLAVFARPRRQRRAKDHGHHRRAAVLAGLSRRRIPRSVLGDDHVLCRDGARHAGRRLAHRAHDGLRITRLTPFQGFCAETGGAITLFTATELGIPVSTTHTITGCIMGVGAARRVSRCAGTSPTGSWWPGSSPSRPRPSLPRWSMPWRGCWADRATRSPVN